MNKKVVLLILDGWGWREEEDGNAILLADTPNMDRLWATYPHTLINASGTFVGLPEGLMGNSEVGHLNLGAGRVVYQDISRIDRAIADGSLFENEALVGIMKAAKKGGVALHFMGLLSDGGVHSHQEHLYSLVRMAKQIGLSKVKIHAILDGRDTPPHHGLKYLKKLDDELRSIGVGEIATVVGRYYCMDRDKRWERVQRAYDMLTAGLGTEAADFETAVKTSYDKDVTDEFVEPIVLTDESGGPRGTIQEGDAVIFFNFRADRAREITRALTEDRFEGFTRRKFPRTRFVCMTQYDESFDLPAAFGPETMENILAQVVADAGKTSLRLAETEKYAHVTYFFSGGVEKEYPGEKRILVPSPKVATYDLKPEMSAPEVAGALVEAIKSGAYDFIVCNFANGDMVGHTGVLDAAIKAAETVDQCLGRAFEVLDLEKTVVIVTSDHGNAEQMIDYENGGPHTAHTTNPVPCILVDKEYKGRLIENGALRDIAPTVCRYLGLGVPAEMTGVDLRAGVVG